MTTAPVLGLPGRAFPVASPRGRTGLLAVPLAGAAVAAVVGGLLALPAPLGVALAGAGLTVLLGFQAMLWTRERRLTGALQRSQSSFQTLVKGSVDPVVILDGRLRISFASQGIADLLGFDAAEVIGLAVVGVVHPDDRSALSDALSADRVRPEELAVRTARIRHADGRWRLIQATVRDLRTDSHVGALVLYCRDVTSHGPAGIDLDVHEFSLTDPVTGLPNRAALVRRLGAVQRGPRDRLSSLALVRISGLASEILAPGIEDAVLRSLTARLTRALRAQDWLARGKDGDFVVLVDGSIADAETVAVRLVQAVGPVQIPGGSLSLTAVAGVTALLPDVDSGEALRRGELALRSARAAGPGSVHRYDDALRVEEDRRATLRADLDSALERGELRLVFQPVVDVVMHRTVSVEALLRWRHPVFGEVSPSEFVPLAEDSPLITELGRWVLREACSTVAELDCAGPPAPEAVSVAVNVSARQVRSGELVPDVLGALEASGLPASRLIVEITESVLLDDSHVIEDLTVLRRLGVRVAVDDFGTGWSSLAYLVGMPVDVLKMDQYFPSGVEHDPARRAMCRAVLQLGSSLGLPVIVEGVTDGAVLTLLRDMGHRYLQGYVFARPLEAAQLAGGAWDVAAERPLAALPGTPS